MKPCLPCILACLPPPPGPWNVPWQDTRGDWWKRSSPRTQWGWGGGSGWAGSLCVLLCVVPGWGLLRERPFVKERVACAGLDSLAALGGTECPSRGRAKLS